MSDYDLFELGDLRLQSGEVLPDARLAYKAYGTLSRERDNVVVFPTAFAWTHVECEQFIGEGLALDPRRYFIVAVNMFGNGLSSSPTNTPRPHDGPQFPNITVHDNVRAQHRLLTERLGIERIRLVTGTSMGALQTFHWAAHYPRQVERIVPTCGASRCSVHNYVFLEGVKAALIGDEAFAGGRYASPPVRGLRAMGRVWAGWALSHAFYREHRYRGMGFDTLEDYLVGVWEARLLRQDPNNLLAMLWTWQHADLSANETFGGDVPRALGAIEADAIVMPSSTDMYFPVEDNAFEVALMRNAELRVIPSLWGHTAGASGRGRADKIVIDAALREILERPTRR